ncbi:MAG TPA: hypothetical protein VF779_07605 [Pyrinomonadaceae bacterium]
MIKRVLIKLIIALSIIGLLPLYSLAQTQTNTQAARKFDEFGDLQFSDLTARLDNFAEQLENEPSAKGFLIVYRARRDLPGLSNRYAQRMKNFLIRSRGLSKDRIVAVDGGATDCFIQELWIVPKGSAPLPRRDAYSRVFEDKDSARKFDEYYFSSPQEKSEVGSFEDIEDEAANLEPFAAALRNESRSQAYIIAYAQAYYLRRPDPPGVAFKMLKTVRDILIRQYHIASSRIKVVNGGYRKLGQVELWIVPRGEHPPIATPNAFPKRRR